MRRGHYLLLGTATVLVMAGCGGNSGDGASGAGSEGKIKVGALLGLTGSYSALGNAELEAIKLFADNANKTGGINGNEIEIVTADTASNESSAVNQLRKLATKDKVDIVLGPSSSGEGIAIKPVATQLKVPVIVPASSDNITNPLDQARYVFKHYHSSVQSVQGQLNYAKKQGWQKVALIYSNNGYGQEAFEAVKSAVPEAGLQLAGTAAFPPTATDVTAQLSSIAGTQPDVTLVWAVNPANGIVAKNAKAINYPGVIFNSPGAGTPAYMETGGDATNGTLVLGSKVGAPEGLKADDPQKEPIDALLKIWKDAGKTAEPNQYNSNGWDISLLMENAVKKANLKLDGSGSQKNRDAIRDALETQTKEFAGLNSVYTYDAEHHGPKDLTGLAVLKVENGKFVLADSI